MVSLFLHGPLYGPSHGQDSDGVSANHLAVQDQMIRIARSLLASCAINIFAYQGCSPLLIRNIWLNISSLRHDRCSRVPVWLASGHTGSSVTNFSQAKGSSGDRGFESYRPVLPRRAIG